MVGEIVAVQAFTSNATRGFKVEDTAAINLKFENGALASTQRWTAILTIALQPPRDAERLKANPLGIYVNAINWSREMGQ